MQAGGRSSGPDGARRHRGDADLDRQMILMPTIVLGVRAVPDGDLPARLRSARLMRLACAAAFSAASRIGPRHTGPCPGSEHLGVQHGQRGQAAHAAVLVVVEQAGQQLRARCATHTGWPVTSASPLTSTPSTMNEQCPPVWPGAGNGHRRAGQSRGDVLGQRLRGRDAVARERALAADRDATTSASGAARRAWRRRPATPARDTRAWRGRPRRHGNTPVCHGFSRTRSPSRSGRCGHGSTGSRAGRRRRTRAARSEASTSSRLPGKPASISMTPLSSATSVQFTRSVCGEVHACR